MLSRSSIGAVALASALAFMPTCVLAFDDAQYPAFSGKWNRAPTPGAPRTPQPAYDPAKGWANGQGAPLTAEYQKIFDANLADQAAGGVGTFRGYACITAGLPGIMTLFQPMEIIILPDTTYVRIDRSNIARRIFTDGRDFPAEIDPAYVGYSIGRWSDTTGSGHYDTLDIESRAFRGPRSYDASGLPLHADNQSSIKEKMYLDARDKDLLHEDITVIDHALTRPWTVNKIYRRDRDPRPVWVEENCSDGNSWVGIGSEAYLLSADGLLMPARKGQPAPDLRYFKDTNNQAKK
jgi:hypothetical protein